MEFVKAWYPDLNLAQLATFRQEAAPELAAASRDLTPCMAAIADYADTAKFFPELNLLSWHQQYNSPVLCWWVWGSLLYRIQPEFSYPGPHCNISR